MDVDNINLDCRMTHYMVSNSFFKKSNMVVVDVGALGGAKRYWNNNYHDQVKIIGFEPDREECSRLNKNLVNEKHVYYPRFLFSQAGRKKFYITRNPGSSSFYSNTTSHWNRYPDKSNLEVTKTVEVDTDEFNFIARENNIDYVDFFKIDAEGSELDVLKGATNFLGNTGILGAELEIRFWSIQNQPVFSEVDAFMRSHGFFLYDLSLHRHSKSALTEAFRRDSTGRVVPRSTKKGQLIWGDALYLRDPVGEMNEDSLNEVAWPDLRILKMASLMELFNLKDCSIELLQHSESKGKLKNIDVETLVNHLTPRYGFKKISYKDYMDHIEKGESRSDKIEAIFLLQ